MTITKISDHLWMVIVHKRVTYVTTQPTLWRLSEIHHDHAALALR